MLSARLHKSLFFKRYIMKKYIERNGCDLIYVEVPFDLTANEIEEYFGWDYLNNLDEVEQVLDISFADLQDDFPSIFGKSFSKDIPIRELTNEQKRFIQLFER